MVDGTQHRARITGIGRKWVENMAEILAVKTSHLGCEIPSTVAAVWAEALFASTIQSSESPGPGHVRRAVATTVQRLGTRGCAAEMAREFGEHPDAAAARMGWALATIRTMYPPPTTIPTGIRGPLALAS
jgi:hypothetical protein